MLFGAWGRYSHSNLLLGVICGAPYLPWRRLSVRVLSVRLDLRFTLLAEEPTGGSGNVNHSSEPMQFGLQDPCLHRGESAGPSASAVSQSPAWRAAGISDSF